MTALEPSAWEARIQRAHAAYPSTAVNITGETTALVVNGDEIIVHLLRNVLAIDHVQVRRGNRPDVDPDEGRARLRQLRGQDFTTDAFPHAFRGLIAGRSLENIRRRTGMSKANLSRLLNGVKAPRFDEMETIAAAFEKNPMYFAEYRAATISALVLAYLAADPDGSALLAHQMGLGR